MPRVTFDNVQYEVVDAGSNGDCFFKCLAREINIRASTVRANIVNHVGQNWESFDLHIQQIFGINNKETYKQVMRKSGIHASLVECTAAAQYYKINIIVIRLNQDKSYYTISNRTPNSTNTIYLMLTGHHQDNHRDGHFQILKPITHSNNKSGNINSDNRYNSNSNDSNYTETMDCSDSIESESDSDEFDCIDNEISESSSDKKNYFTDKEKILILRAVKFFAREKKEKKPIKFGNIIERTAECFEISPSTIQRICKTDKNRGSLKIKRKSGRPRIPFDPFLQGIIRQTIHGFYAEKTYPTMEMVRRKVQDECQDIPDFKLTTLKNWCEKLNFSYKKFNKKPVWMESVSIAAQRDTYLRKIAQYRNNCYSIYYTDETWCGANHSRKYGWIETIQSSEVNNFDSDRCRVQKVFSEKGGFLTPSGSGKRVILLDIGGVNGFVPGCRLCFIGKKGSADYHNEMNAEHYIEWFKKVLKVLPDKSVIVLDQAPYHKMLDPDFRNPTTGWRKQNVVDWLVNRPVPLPPDIKEFEDLTKSELLELAKSYHHPPQYLLEKIAREERGNEVRLLWLPVAHCEYNPIELIWAYVKNDVAKNNSTFKINDVLNLCTNVMDNIPPSLWPDCIKHTEKEEAKARIRCLNMDREIEPMIIRFDESNESDSNSEFDSDYG